MKVIKPARSLIKLTRRKLLAGAAASLVAAPAFSFYQSRDSNYNVAISAGGSGGNNLVLDASSTPANTTNGNPLVTNALTTTGGNGIAIVLVQANGVNITCTASSIGAMTRHGSEIAASSG